MTDRERVAQYWYDTQGTAVVYGCWDENTPPNTYSWFDIVSIDGNVLNQTPLPISHIPDWKECLELLRSNLTKVSK
jgi:hypothetical protein